MVNVATGKMRTCGPADRPTGKLRTGSQVWFAFYPLVGLQVRKSAGPHITRARVNVFQKIM